MPSGRRSSHLMSKLSGLSSENFKPDGNRWDEISDPNPRIPRCNAKPNIDVLDIWCFNLGDHTILYKWIKKDFGIGTGNEGMICSAYPHASEKPTGWREIKKKGKEIMKRNDAGVWNGKVIYMRLQCFTNPMIFIGCLDERYFPRLSLLVASSFFFLRYWNLGDMFKTCWFIDAQLSG